MKQVAIFEALDNGYTSSTYKKYVTTNTLLGKTTY